MKDMRVVRFNEKLRRISTLTSNGGLALLIGGLSHWYQSGLDIYAGTWILLAAFIIWMSVQMNELLDSED